MDKDEIVRGLLQNPKSEKLHRKFLDLSKSDRNYVMYYVSLEEMGTGLPSEDFNVFWNFVKGVNNGSQSN